VKRAVGYAPRLWDFFLIAFCLLILLIFLKQYPLGARYFGEIRDEDNTFVAGQSGLGVVGGSVAGNDFYEDFFYHVLRICMSCRKHLQIVTHHSICYLITTALSQLISGNNTVGYPHVTLADGDYYYHYSMSQL
jgi:hypothetical protein